MSFLCTAVLTLTEVISLVRGFLPNCKQNLQQVYAGMLRAVLMLMRTL